MPKFLIAKWSMTRAKEADKKETTHTVVASLQRSAQNGNCAGIVGITFFSGGKRCHEVPRDATRCSEMF